MCAYAGTGNVLKVQEMLHICTDHYETEDSSKSKDKKDKTTSKDKEDKDKKEDAKDKDSKDKKEEEKDIDLSSQQSIAVLGERN